MKAMMAEERLSIIVDGVDNSALDFYRQWLSMAAHLDDLWAQVRTSPEFEPCIASLLDSFMPDFRQAALDFYMALHPRPVFVIDVASATATEFAVMVEVGLFRYSEGRYRFDIPDRLDLDDVRRAALKYYATQNDSGVLHAETLVTAMLDGEAQKVLQQAVASDELSDTPFEATYH
jgi:hypothetical protein